MPALIPFIDLAAQRRRLGARIDAALGRVLEHGQYIMGPEVAALEARLAAFCGARHAITCASGTDALLLALLAKGVGPGDAVLVPTFTFIATAEVVALLGAVPVFCDVGADTFNLAAEHLAAGLETARHQELRPRGVIAVDLFGQPADYGAIQPFCDRHGLWLMADAAQSFGAGWRGRPVGRLAEITATSFFPSKPLGCYGDGGAVLTDDDALAETLRSLRIHGQGQDKYDNVRIGINGRLDTLQAAVLLEKLEIFEDELDVRQEIAARYAAALEDVVRVPRLRPGARSVWAQYTVVVETGSSSGPRGSRTDTVPRAALVAALAAAGIPSAVYYRTPLHRQPAYRHLPVAAGGLPVAEWLAERVLSLPMHPYLAPDAQDLIVSAVRAASRRGLG